MLICSTVLILLGGIAMWEIEEANKHAHLVAISQKHLFPMENVINIDEESKSPIYMGLVAYERMDYKTTVEKLQTTPKWQLSPALRLYLGIALLYDNQLTDATEQFQQVIANEKKRKEDGKQDRAGKHYEKEAKWYLSLTYLQMEEVEKAKALLRDIETGDDMRERVSVLLSELEENMIE